jgi:hypothetical protein
MAGLFRDERAVVGYQLLSQPFVGNYYLSPSLLYPGENDARNLAAVYAFLSKKIRSVDNNHILFFSDTHALPLSPSLYSLPSDDDDISETPSSSPPSADDTLATHTHSGFKRLPTGGKQQKQGRGGRKAPQEEWWTEEGDGGVATNRPARAHASPLGPVVSRDVLALSYECWYFDQLEPFPFPAHREICNVFKGEGTRAYTHARTHARTPQLPSLKTFPTQTC